MKTYFYDGEAELVDWGMSKTASGADKFVAVFKCEAGTFDYSGSFSTEKSTQFLVKALITLGLSTPDNLEAVADGPDGQALEMGKKVNIKVEERTLDNGKTIRQVAWINPMRASKFKADPLLKLQAKSSLAGLAGQVADLIQSTANKKEMPF